MSYPDTNTDVGYKRVLTDFECWNCSNDVMMKKRSVMCMIKRGCAPYGFHVCTVLIFSGEWMNGGCV